MTAFFVAWAISAVVLVVLAGWLGATTRDGRWSGILIDPRGRYSLTHFQVVLWSIVVLSLVSGVFWGRLVHGVHNPLGFSIPDEVLGLMGISVGSAVTAGAVKAGKDADPNVSVADASRSDPAFSQVFLLEEGAQADRVVDVTKFQSFVVTIVLAVAYVVLCVHTIDDARAVTALPTFSGTFLVLLGISHGGYIAGKVPKQEGTAAGRRRTR